MRDPVRPDESLELPGFFTLAMIAKLRLREDDLLVQLGCAAGLHALEIRRQVRMRYQAIAVDPSGKVLDRMPVHPDVRFVQMDALRFSEQPVQYDKILVVDGIAHLRDPSRLFANLFRRLNGDGVLLLAEHRQVWQLHVDCVASLLEGSGFDVESQSLTRGTTGCLDLVTATKPERC